MNINSQIDTGKIVNFLSVDKIKLPNEIYKFIFLFLTPKDHQTLTTVNKRWSKIVIPLAIYAETKNIERFFFYMKDRYSLKKDEVNVLEKIDLSFLSNNLREFKDAVLPIKINLITILKNLDRFPYNAQNVPFLLHDVINLSILYRQSERDKKIGDIVSLAETSKKLAKAGDFEKSLELAYPIYNKSLWTRTLYFIVICAKNYGFQNNIDYKTLLIIANALANKPEGDNMFDQFAKKHPHINFMKDEMCDIVARGLADHGQYAQAKELANRVSNLNSHKTLEYIKKLKNQNEEECIIQQTF